MNQTPGLYKLTGPGFYPKFYGNNAYAMAQEARSITIIVNVVKLLSHVLLSTYQHLDFFPPSGFHVFPLSVLADILPDATAMYIFTCVLYIHAGFIELWQPL